MVQEANVKRAQAEKTLAESVMKVGNKFLYFYVSLSLRGNAMFDVKTDAPVACCIKKVHL